MKNRRLKDWIHFLQFPVSITFMEIVLVLHCFDRLFGWGVLYTFLFSLVFGGVCTILTSVWGKRGNRVVSIVLFAVLALVFGTQAVYFTLFKTFTGFYALTLAGDAIGEFWKQALNGIWDTKLPLLFVFLPLILNCVFGKRCIPEKRLKLKWCVLMVVVMAAVQTGTAMLVGLNSTGIMSYRYVYYDTYSSLLSVPRFGVLTTMRLELRQMGRSNEQPDVDEFLEEALPTVSPSATPSPSPSATPAPDETAPSATPSPVYADNVLEIDFDALIAGEQDSAVREMHEYFATQEPTTQNEHTGMFEGKNLIWIVAESYSAGALDETHTPTLYKLANEGFVFKNFYNPIWYGSTSDGEFVTLTGLLPKSGSLSFKASSGNYMPFGFGNLFNKLGYVSKAYHNHTYTYYGRDKSHPNLGYDYMGVGNGMVVKKQWPESDIEMIDQTTELFVNEALFDVYYLTVSGHMMYTFNDNMMSYKHMEDVADLPYSEASRAYIAAMMETDQALKLLLDRLEEAGKLEDTVIVLSGDHYPYGLDQASLTELGMPNDNFELYRSSLIIWNSEMETEVVDKYCSSVDVMPTLANLFGLRYDSRLISGRDIFSSAPALVMFNNRSFITDAGRYNSPADTFEPNENAVVPEGYAAAVLGVVNDRFAYAAKIIEQDYYAKVFGED